MNGRVAKVKEEAQPRNGTLCGTNCAVNEWEEDASELVDI
jgi:hypothetical protein